MSWQKAAVFTAIVSVLVVLGLAAARERPPWSAPLVGGPAPDFTLTLFDGGRLRLLDLRGKVVVVNFWASWCTACRQESSVLQWTWQTYRSRGLVLVGVNIWDDRADALRMIGDPPRSLGGRAALSCPGAAEHLTPRSLGLIPPPMGQAGLREGAQAVAALVGRPEWSR